MKKRIITCCACLLLSGCLAKHSDYTEDSVNIAKEEFYRIQEINTGLEKIATALVSNLGNPPKEEIVSTENFSVSVNQTGAEWMARLMIAEKIMDAYKVAVQHRPVVINEPVTGERIGLEIAKQATGLTGILGGVVAFGQAMRPPANVQQSADQGGTIGPGSGTSAPSITTVDIKTETGGTEE